MNSVNSRPLSRREAPPIKTNALINLITIKIKLSFIVTFFGRVRGPNKNYIDSSIARTNYHKVESSICFQFVCDADFVGSILRSRVAAN